MSHENSDEIASRLKKISEDIELLIKLAAFSLSKDAFFKNKTNKNDQIDALSDLGFNDDLIGIILGISVRSVRVIRSSASKRKMEHVEPEVTFQIQDLCKILANNELFASKQELVDFAEEPLQLRGSITVDMSNEEIINQIFHRVAKADRIKQALFVQALELRATARKLKDTRFSRFLDSWESHIKG